MVTDRATPTVIPVMALLRGGIPLTLLFDLIDPAGPHSSQILAEERLAS